MRRIRAIMLLLLPWLLWALPAWADGPQFTNTCASISWTADSDVDLAGYKLYDQISLTAAPTIIAIVGPSITSIPCPQFNAGQHYLSITSFDTSSNESAHSSLVPFTIVSNQVTDLRVTVVNATDMTLTWTEVDGGNGLPASYDVRLATPTISWASAASVTSGTCATPVAGTTIGASKSCTVTALALATPYQFQLVPYSGTLGQPGVIFGPLSNITGATTGGSVPGTTRTILNADVFPGADGALPSPWQGGYTSKGTPQIVSHTAQGSTLGLEHYAAYVTATPDIQFAKINIAMLLASGGAVSELGILLRATAPPDVSFVLLYLQKVASGGTLTSAIGTYTSGTWAYLTTENATAWAATDDLIAEATGTTFNLYRSSGGVETLILTQQIADVKFSIGYTGLYTHIGTGGTITNAAIGSFQMGTLTNGATDICGCDNH